MRRMLLALALAACAVMGCQPVASPLAPISPTPSAASRAPAPQAPTTNVSPAPSDGRLVADDRPHFLFQAAGENRLRAVIWSDATTGVMPGEIPLKAIVWQSPDGRRYVLNGKIYAADGRELGTLPWQDGSLPTWSRDGEFLCRAMPETRQTGALMQLQTVVPGQPPRIVATGYGIYGDNASYPVLACDATSDRAIVASFGQGLFAGHLWVFRLSTGALIRSEDLGANVAGSWLAASADGTLLAHSVRRTNADPPTTTIRTAESPTALQTLPNFEGHGFSGDASLLIGVLGGANSVAIVDWKARAGSGARPARRTAATSQNRAARTSRWGLASSVAPRTRAMSTSSVPMARRSLFHRAHAPFFGTSHQAAGALALSGRRRRSRDGAAGAAVRRRRSPRRRGSRSAGVARLPDSPSCRPRR